MKFLYKFERAIYGRLFLQPVFESLHRIGLRGMNFMQSQLVAKTGEIEVMKYILNKHKNEDGWNLLDVGANEGQFVNELGKIFTDPFQIHSFEPSKFAYERLIHKSNHNNIRFYNHGFGNKSGQAHLFNSGALTGTIYPLDFKKNDYEIINLQTIDDFCAEKEIDRIFYLKIDVEGSELNVLKGCIDMLEKCKIRFIQFEYGPNCMEAKVYLKDFFEILQGYSIYRIVKDGIRRIKKYGEIIEIPLTSNFLAELNSN